MTDQQENYIEPTDEELDELMSEVIKKVNSRALLSKKIIEEAISLEIAKAKEKLNAIIE